MNHGFYSSSRALASSTMGAIRPVNPDYARRARPGGVARLEARGVSATSVFFQGMYARAETASVPEAHDEDPSVEALNQLLLMSEGWDGRGAPAPSVDAIRIARGVLRAGRQTGLPIARVVPDVEGGVATYFFGGTKMIDAGWSRSAGLLTSNDGEVALYLRDRVVGATVIDPSESTETGVMAAVLRIKSFLLGL